MNKKYLAAFLIVAVAAIIVVYLSGGSNSILEKARLGLMPDTGGKSSVKDLKRAAADKAVDDIISNLTKNGLPKDRTIVKGSGGRGGGGGGGSSGNAGGCTSESYMKGSADYFVKARIDKIENKWNGDKTQMITYMYAGTDEYGKENSTNPDINPDKFLIISPADNSVPEGTNTFVNEPVFIYTELKIESWGFSMVC